MKPYEKYVYLNNRETLITSGKTIKRLCFIFVGHCRIVIRIRGMEFERNLTMINLGEVFLMMHQTDSASYYLERCYDFFHSIKNNSALYYIDSQLIELALEQGDV